jgi:hypothetical protein
MASRLSLTFTPQDDFQSTQSMDTEEELPTRAPEHFWEIEGPCTILVSYLDPKAAEAVASWSFPRDSFRIFTTAIKSYTHTDYEGVNFLCTRLYATPSLIDLFKDYLSLVKTINFATFPDPNSFALGLTSNPKTWAPILFHSRAHFGCLSLDVVRKVVDALLQNHDVLRKEGIRNQRQLKAELLALDQFSTFRDLLNGGAIAGKGKKRKAEEAFPDS